MVYIGVHVGTLLLHLGGLLVALPFCLVGGVNLLEGAIFTAVACYRGGAAPAFHAWFHTCLRSVFEASSGIATPAASALAPHVITARVKAAHCIVCLGSLSNRDTVADGVYSVIYCGYIYYGYILSYRANFDLEN